VEQADALGIPPGPERGALQRGDSITLDDGRTITPDAVLGPARAGRKLVLSGDTMPAASVLEIAHAADLLVHEATFAADEEDRARETMHSTAREAAELARAAEVKMLALTHLSNRYFGSELAREARAVFAETVVPRDFDIIDLRFEERGGPLLVKGGAPARQAEETRKPVPIAEGSSS
jgi:ribonuclease Z